MGPWYMILNTQSICNGQTEKFVGFCVVSPTQGLSIGTQRWLEMFGRSRVGCFQYGWGEGKEYVPDGNNLKHKQSKSSQTLVTSLSVTFLGFHS